MIFSGTSYDEKYLKLCQTILDEGHYDLNPRPKYEDGQPAHAKSIFNYEFKIGENEIPILFSKQLYFRQAVEEMLWIWQKRSTTVKDLQDKKVHIWDEWEQSDGTIGKAYGYQLRKEVDDSGLNQVDNLIQNLKKDPESRRHIVTLWNINEGHEMALKPCVYETQWVVLNNKLHLKVLIRSNDIALIPSAF